MSGHSDLKAFVGGAYDLQKLRIQIGLRIVVNFKSRLGQVPGAKEDTLELEAQNIIKEIRKSYHKFLDGLEVFPRASSFEGDNIISDYTILCLVSQYIDIEKEEKIHFGRLPSLLKEHKIWTEFLEGVKGVGPAMGAVIISEFDIRKAKYPSSFWMYAGLDTGPDGKGRSRRSEHLVETEYTDKDGVIKTKMGITFNPFLKTKLVGVLGASFLRAGDNKYSDLYRNYKNRLENMPEHKEKSKGHRHNMSIRRMIKIFLMDLHLEWKRIEGLEIPTPYFEDVLGMKHDETAIEQKQSKGSKRVKKGKPKPKMRGRKK